MPSTKKEIMLPHIERNMYQMQYDIVVVGGGIVGLSIAREMRRRHPHLAILVLEKETSSTRHGSGRNSGVIHAGFYYSPESLKAQLTRDGNQLLKEFCANHQLKLLNCGKVVVTSDKSQVPQLEELYRRGQENGVDVHLISDRELKEIEPLAITREMALWSPNTSVADPIEVTAKVSELAKFEGIDVRFGEKVLDVDQSSVWTSHNRIVFRHLINTAGLYADRFAQKLGYSDEFVVLPFVGLYAYAPSLSGLLQRHVYPVPDPRNPFLGVHATLTVDGKFKIGPTAIPAFSREAYRGLRDVKFNEARENMKWLLKLLRSPHHDISSLLQTELPKYFRTKLVHEASKLIPMLRRRHFTIVGKPGIRAQLYNHKENRLEMDFIIRGDDKSTHVLNAISPAWTSSFSFAKYVADDIERRVF